MISIPLFDDLVERPALAVTIGGCHGILISRELFSVLFDISELPATLETPTQPHRHLI